MASISSTGSFQSLYNKHRPGVALCLCSTCVRPWESKTVREPNTKYPDCSDCYLYFNHVLNDYYNCYCDIHQEQVIPTPDRRKADPNCEYAFTLTMPPDYQPKKPIEEAARLIMEHGWSSNTNKKGTPSNAEKACEWAFVKEHTEKGTPHVHGVYKTPSGRRIEAKYFNRYWDLWTEPTENKKGNNYHGHKGGYHCKARHSESYKAYMEKEGVVVKNPPEPDLISHI